ncbi:MAG: TonB-dependent receptor [Chloroherpetonaceae bacterium]|nr:TonB-dependent receptor [Chloroherpetonaceae bacterium]
MPARVQENFSAFRRKAIGLALCLWSLVALAMAQPRASSGFGTLRGTVYALTNETVLEKIVFIDTLAGEKTEREVRRRKREPIAGAKVRILGASLGALTDANGFYLIRNVPRGLYDIAYSAEGYKTDIFKNVWIKSDTITEIDILLEENVSAQREIVVTANRFEQRLQDVSISTSLLEPDFIVNRNSVSIDEALRFVSGVNFAGPDINIRGSSGVSFGVGSRAQLLVDNVPLMAGDDGSAKWDAFPTDFIERVEVVKGASAIYGASALGGTVNIVTRNSYETQTGVLAYGGVYDSPRFERWKWTSDARFFNGMELSHRRQLGKLGAYLSLSRRSDEGFRENSDFARLRLFAKTAYRISDESNLATLFTFAEERKGNAIYWQDINNVLRDGSRSGSRLYSDKLFLAPIYSKKLSQRSTLLLRGRYYRTNFIDSQGQGSLANSVGTELQVISLVGSKFSWTWGGDAQFATISSSLTGEHKTFGFAAYGQVEFPLMKKLALNFGARLDGLVVFSDSLAGEIKSGQVVPSLNPKMGLVYALDDYSSLRTHFGTSFRNPAITERFTTTASPPIVPNPSLKPERALSGEVGYIFSYSRPTGLFAGVFLSEITLDAAAYLNLYRNLIEPTLARGGISFRNVSDARIAGTELSATFNFNRRAALVALSYTWLDARDQTRAAPLYYRNPRLLYVTTELNYGRFSLEWNYRFIARFSATNPDAPLIFGLSSPPILNVDETVDAHIHDLRFGIRLPFGTLNLYARNLFNYAYVEQPATLAPLRHFLMQFRTQF